MSTQPTRRQFLQGLVALPAAVAAYATVPQQQSIQSYRRGDQAQDAVYPQYESHDYGYMRNNDQVAGAQTSTIINVEEPGMYLVSSRWQVEAVKDTRSAGRISQQIVKL